MAKLMRVAPLLLAGATAAWISAAPATATGVAAGLPGITISASQGGHAGPDGGGGCTADGTCGHGGPQGGGGCTASGICGHGGPWGGGGCVPGVGCFEWNP
ncbi:PE-PGRS family protein [Mycolicibacterium sp. XJ1819]